MNPVVVESKKELQHEQLVKQTQKWVGMTFYGELMKEMRNDPFRSKLFDGGRGGQAFGEMYDQELAQRMGKGTANKLVDAIVKRIEGNHAAGAAGAAGADGREMNIGRDARIIPRGSLQDYVSTDIRA